MWTSQPSWKEGFELKRLIFTLNCLLLIAPCAAETTADHNELDTVFTCISTLSGDTFDTFQIETLQTNPPYGERLWNGNNPFHQPAATMDYYGSGDVDNDGNLTTTDASFAQDMADGTKPPSPRADVDGDGDVDSSDVSLINSALSGGILPAWWNSLTSRTQRNYWLTKCLAIDQTDAHPWRYWFACGNFATQTFIHGAFHRADIHPTFHDGGPTVFNLPVYIVTVAGHGINAVLVGDDPLNFDDWRFFEPQTDGDISPGVGIPYESLVRIVVTSKLTGTGFSYSHSTDKKVEFYVDQTGCTLQYYNPELILTRPAPPVVTPDNRPDLWNPRIVPLEQGMILFERTRKDMSRMTDIHLADLPLVDPPAGTPLVLSSQYSRLLDTSQGPDGTIHLLSKGKPDYVPGVFHGKFDPITHQLTDVTRVSTGTRQVRMGRIIVTPTGQIHVFWLELKSSGTGHPYESGIYWTRWTGADWQSDENVASYTTYTGYFDYCEWDKPDLLRYYFDADVSENGDIILVWAEPNDSANEATIRQLRYDGEWGTATDIETTNVCGIELSNDSAGTLHMAYWSGDCSYGGRGNLLHRTSDNNAVSWSAPEVIDATENASCPHMIAGDEGAVYLVWERKVDAQVVPVWSKYENGLWYTEQVLSVRDGADAWYPTAGLLPDGSVVVTWSSRSTDRATIETRKVFPYVSDFDGDDNVDLEDFVVLAAAWRSRPGDQNWNPFCDISYPNDNFINERDLAVLADDYLKETP